MSQCMEWKAWSHYDAIGLAGLLDKRKVTAEELARQVQTATQALNPKIGPVVELFDDAIADPSTDGTNLHGPFKGVPLLMKDLGPAIKGRLQEQGSKFLKGNRNIEDAFLTKRIRKAGLNIIGRTTVPEFGVCSSVENPDIYTTRNPWNPDYTSFGSSAGACVAVASGILPLAHGTDGGGSIRIPAANNGLIGLKASRGVFSISPNLSDISGYVSTQGCVSRTVRDSAAFLDYCRGGDVGEFMPYWKSNTSYLKQIQQDPAPLKIALSHEWANYRSESSFIDALNEAGCFLEALGHKVDYVVPSVDFSAAYQAQTTCYISNFAQFIARWLEKKGLQRPPQDLIEPINIKIWEAGVGMLYTERWKMQDIFNKVSRQLGQFYEDWDIILTPTFAKMTPQLGDKTYLTTSDEPCVLNWFESLWGIFPYTPIASLTGTPAISIPMGRQENGLPLGMQAQTRQGDDGLLLQLAAQIERALGPNFNQPIPMVHVSNLANHVGGL